MIAALQQVTHQRTAAPRLPTFVRRSVLARASRLVPVTPPSVGAGVILLLLVGTGAWILNREAAPSRSSPNEQANEAYLRGRALVLRPIAEDLKQAASFFQEAIRLDPDFPDAWAGLASAYKRMPITGALPPRDAFPRAEEAARKALSLDPTTPRPIRHSAPRRSGSTGITLPPNGCCSAPWSCSRTHADAHLFLAHLYSNIGRDVDALRHIRRARDLDRQWAQPRALEGLFLTWGRKYTEAVAHLDAVTTVTDPNLWTAHAFRADALLALGRTDEAMRAYDRSMAVGGHAFQHGQRPILPCRRGPSGRGGGGARHRGATAELRARPGPPGARPTARGHRRALARHRRIGW